MVKFLDLDTNGHSKFFKVTSINTGRELASGLFEASYLSRVGGRLVPTNK